MLEKKEGVTLKRELIFANQEKKEQSWTIPF